MFGPLQRYASDALLLSTVLVAAAQTLGGSIGSGVAPDKALIGVSVIDTEASEGEVMRRALPYGLLCVLIIGLEVLVVSMVSQQ
jgi:lactate permease